MQIPRAGRARLLTILGIVTSSSVAAGEVSPDPRCAGVHSLWSPVPDACLEVIDTDRPHQTDTPHTVPAGHAQLESGIAAVQIGGVEGAPPGTRGARLVFFENAYKLGLVSRIELQLGYKHAEYVVDRERFVAPGPFLVRAKLNVLEERGFLPAVTLVPTVVIPMDPSHALRAGGLVFWGWELPLRFEVEMNAGALFSAASKPSVLVLASALTHSLTERLKIFAEVYAAGWDVSLGTGLLFSLTRDVQIDAGTYLGLNGAAPLATPFVGLSLRR